jgi:hypothetical protein
MPGFFVFWHLLSIFYCDFKCEFFITHIFTGITMLHLLRLLGNVRVRMPSVRVVHSISAYPVSRRPGRADWSQSQTVERME